MFKKILIANGGEIARYLQYVACVGAPCALRMGGAQPQAERPFNGSPRLAGKP
jgi:hypothetical protein